MDVMKFKIQSSWFGLRQRLMMQVYPDPLTGEPEPYWIEASQHNLNLVANRLQRLQEENKNLHAQARERQRKDRENPRRTLPLTLKELSVSVMDAVDRALSTNPLLRATHDKLFPLATGGFVPYKDPGVVGEHAEASPVSRAAASAESELKGRVNPGWEVRVDTSQAQPLVMGVGLSPGAVITEAMVEGCSITKANVELCPNAPAGPVFEVTILDGSNPSETAEKIAEAVRAVPVSKLLYPQITDSPPKD